MEVEVISNEITKPSSPTPSHLSPYKFSFLDQLCPKAYNPFLYFYALNYDHKIADISDKLKKSLSQALTLYYPLAGRFMDENFLECNDVGALFLEAQVKTKLSNVVENSIPCGELNKLLPFELEDIAELPLGVQLNVFECGGIALGVCISHKLADALSCLVFIRSWMAIACGENDDVTVVRPDFVSASLFPPWNMCGTDTSSFTMLKKNTVTTKRFVFDVSKIESLREKYAAKTRGEKSSKRPSRVEAVSAFIWSRFIAATKVESEAAGKLYTLNHAVNLRPRFNLPLPEHSFGNLFCTSTTIPSMITNNGEESYNYSLARKIGEDIKKIDMDYIEDFRLERDDFLENYKKNAEKFVNEEIVPLVFTSLCRFPLYEADFGFGKPVWVSSAARCFRNTVSFMDNKSGDGIEAYICLKPDDMAKFEVDQEFLAFLGS